MAQEKFVDAIEHIKEIYTNLYEKEPSPDEEIEAKEDLIFLLKQLLDNISGFEDKQQIIQDTLEIVEIWDTLDLWFKEVENLPKNIKEIIEYREERRPKEEGLKPEEKIEPSPVFDIKKIISQVSGEFKGEISKLKDHIADLEIKLKEKDLALTDGKTISLTKRPPKIPAKHGNRPKLQPPKVIIPQIGPPMKKPKTKPEVETTPKVETTPFLEKKPKVGLVSPNTTHFTPIPKKITTIGEEIPTISAETQISTKKPKITHVSAEEIEIIDEKEREIKDLPFSISKPKSTPSSTDKLSISEALEESTSPIPKKPKITPVKFEDVDLPSEIEGKSELEIPETSKKLYDVFSSAGSVESKSKQKGEEKVVDSYPQTFSPGKDTISEQSDISITDDKDKLYQDLIALEGKRYSIEKMQQESEIRYKDGQIDDVTYKQEMDKIKGEMGKITSRINEIRKIIQGL